MFALLLIIEMFSIRLSEAKENRITVFVKFNYKKNVFDLPFINVTIPPFKLRAECAATR